VLHNPNAASGRGAIAKFHIKRDTTYASSPERLALVAELVEILGGEKREEFKKSQDPISVLTIAAFLAGGIAAGFLRS
jgi:hypothetical protein